MKRFEMAISDEWLARVYPEINLVILNREAKQFFAELVLHELSEESIARSVWKCKPNFPQTALHDIAHNVNAESLGEYEYLRADLTNKYIMSDRLSDISGNPEERTEFKNGINKLRKMLYR